MSLNGTVYPQMPSKLFDKIHDMVLSKRRIRVRELLEATGLSQGIVFSIFHEKLGVQNIPTRCVPRLFLVENKRILVIDSDPGLALFHRDPDEFLRRYLTNDNMRVHCLTPETKNQSK